MRELRLLSGQRSNFNNSPHSRSLPTFHSKQNPSLEHGPPHIRGVVKLQRMLHEKHIRAQDLIRLVLKAQAETTNNVRSGNGLGEEKNETKGKVP